MYPSTSYHLQAANSLTRQCANDDGGGGGGDGDSPTPTSFYALLLFNFPD